MLLSAPLIAASPPDAGAVQRLERDQLEQLMREERLRRAPIQPDITLPGAPEARAASEVKNIPVRSFQVDASAILSDDEIRAVLAPLEGQTVSLADLFAAVGRLNALYDARRMPTARAILPPQTIADGVVRIRLVEARVGSVELGDMTQVTPAFVQSRLSLEPGELMSVPMLEADLIRFNRLHEVQLRARVQAGREPGTTDLLLDVMEPERNRYSLFIDNAGRYTVGEERVGLIARRTGLTRRGDVLSLTATLGEGSEAIHLGYATPLNPRDLKLELNYSRGGIEVVQGSFAPLDITGESEDLSIGLSYPLRVEATRMWSLYGRLSAKTSVSEFGGVTQQEQALRVFTLGASGEGRDEDSTWLVDVNLGMGMTGWGGDASYTALRVQTAWLQRLSARTHALLRGGLQLAEDPLLPAAEQFQLGGSGTVRGYSEGLLSGRQGYSLSAELRHALMDPETYLLRNPGAPVFTGLLFLDHGGAFPFRPAPLKDVTDDDYLTGAGLGIMMDWNSRVLARLALAWPLNPNPGEAREREPRLHAWISATW